MKHNLGPQINAFWKALGVPRERVYARRTPSGVVLSYLVDGLPKDVKVDQQELMRLTNRAIDEFKRTNKYKDDPEMQS